MSSAKAVTIPATVIAAIQNMKRGVEKCDAYDAVIGYAMDGTEPDDDLSGTVRAMFDMAKALIDSTRQ